MTIRVRIGAALLAPSSRRPGNIPPGTRKREAIITAEQHPQSFEDGILPDAPVDHIDLSHVQRLADAMRTGALDAAEDITRAHWFDLALSLRHGVADALEQVPTSRLRDRPLLLMLLGMAYNVIPHRRARGMRCFVTAIFAVRASRQNVRKSDRVLVLTSQSAAFRLIGRPSLGVRPARAALSVLERMDVGELDEVSTRSDIYAHLGISLYYGGRRAEALHAFRRGLAESPSVGYASGFANVSMLCGIHALDGGLKEAAGYAAIAREDRWTDVQRSWYPGTFYRVGEALLALERFDAAAASAHLDAMVHDRRTIEHWRAIASTEAIAALVAGRPGAGLAGLTAFTALRGHESRHAEGEDRMRAVHSLLHLATGNLDAAARALHPARGSTSAEIRVAAARIALTRGRAGEAMQDARVAADRASRPRPAVEAAAIEAACTLQIPGSRRRRAVVEHLAEQLISTGLRLPVALLPPDDYQRLRTALAESGYTALRDELPERSLLEFGAAEPLLTSRELAVLRTMGSNASIPAIAEQLNLSVNTVKTHRRNIYRKLGAEDRDTAIAIALDRGLIAAGRD
ncbi:LuxR C-terminal-related transcriptional regulator [Microbacterium sp. ARD32]|uniref:LuxR C-terminal-related transcriptional regulator n=1 Tax=Microbacterium sp. ARD32 TaxID=2962577 RepID=UPI0028826153|nr:LuxR C-terminal-related transcriptional regulator [Microbacterium sp. ARD32]MDT0157916.1 LuxR C-terminal-related transcriptional regulator [Microbacterium sp. ARD32]